MPYSQQSIFSEKIDSAVFIALPIVLSVFAFWDSALTAGLAILALIFDKLHVHYTFVKSGMISEIKKNTKFRNSVITILLFSFLSLYVAYLYKGVLGINIFIMYFAIFHFCRQQYGWLKIINKKLALNVPASRMSEAFIQTYCFLPILVAHSNVFRFSWFPRTPNLFTISDTLAKGLLGLYALSILFYFSYEITNHLNGKIPFNKTRIAIILFTFFSWNVSILLKPSGMYTALLLLIGHHVFSYVALVYLHNSYIGKQRVSRFFLYTVAIVLLFVIQMASRNSIAGFRSQILDGLNFSLTPSEYDVFNYFIPLLWVTSLIHFLMDGVIWKGHSFNYFNPKR